MKIKKKPLQSIEKYPKLLKIVKYQLPISNSIYSTKISFNNISYTLNVSLNLQSNTSFIKGTNKHNNVLIVFFAKNLVKTKIMPQQFQFLL